MQQWRGASQDGKGGGRRCGYTTHGPRQRRALLSEPQQAAGALASGQWPVGPRTHRHTQRKSARARYGEWPARIHAQVRHTPPGVALRLARAVMGSAGGVMSLRSMLHHAYGGSQCKFIYYRDTGGCRWTGPLDGAAARPHKKPRKVELSQLKSPLPRPPKQVHSALRAATRVM